MNTKIKELIAKGMKVSIEDISEENSADIYDYLDCLSPIQTTVVDSYRWWDEMETVVELEKDFFVAFTDAHSTGDNTPSDLGYEQPPISDIREVRKKVIEQIIYV